MVCTVRIVLYVGAGGAGGAGAKSDVTEFFGHNGVQKTHTNQAVSGRARPMVVVLLIISYFICSAAPGNSDIVINNY